MKKRVLIVLVVLAALLAFGALTVLAQGPDDGDGDGVVPPCWGPGHMHGHMWSEGFTGWPEECAEDMDGFTGFGPGMMMGGAWRADAAPPMWTAIAEALGMDQDALVEAFQAGTTVAELAEAQGVELDAIVGAILSEHATHAAEMVAAGHMTAEQVAEMTAWMAENLTAQLEAGFGAGMPCLGGAAFGAEAGYGPGMMHGGYGPGMMGHGFGGRGRW